jgi:hypothetical protein
MHIMQSVVQDSDTLEIMFPTKQDRTHGIAVLFRSRIVWNGTADKFYVKREHLKLLDDRDIKYSRIP